MIKVSKPKIVPDKLTDEGKTANDINCAAYTADPQSYIDGSSKFIIKNSIYGHPSVKKVLREGQGNKCCYCEKDIKDEDGAVEHYRPKAGYKKGTKLIRPGYYWLGYEWSNLYFVCTRCNGSGNKGNLFPLLDDLKRVKSHTGDIKDETPLLLDPGGQKNPKKHIVFENEFPKGVSEYGQKTIEICGLNRDELNNDRKKLIADINARIAILITASIQTKDLVDEAKQFIKNSKKEDAEFSATAIDYLNSLK